MAWLITLKLFQPIKINTELNNVLLIIWSVAILASRAKNAYKSNSNFVFPYDDGVVTINPFSRCLMAFALAVVRFHHSVIYEV